MIPANTICVSQEGPANALALNKDCTQVVIAGRNVFKVFSLGENEFSEVCNLRVGKNLNLNFSSIDVAWSTIEENTLATAATNGAVVVWNLGRSGRSKQEHVFSDHKRTVNKVSFHLTDPALLISGSQDGMMKCFDLRMKDVARTFISNTESIRDVQFSPHQAHTFAAVSENGSAQLWDVRRHERCLQQFTAHSGPVFACDWHPEMPWLATASRDKTIKVWDIHAKPNLEHTIYTIASVGHVKWRPQKTHQVASCALVLDNSVHVWDVRRPHVPLATFAEHRDVTTAVAWLGGPHSFLSTSRDCSLYRHRFVEAAHPVLWANPQALCFSPRGDIAHAAPERPLPPLNPAPRPDRPPPALGRKQPTAGSLSASSQAALERAFPGGSASTFSHYKVKPELAEPPTPPSPPPPGPPPPPSPPGRDEDKRKEWPLDLRAAALVGCARGYRIRGAPPHELADHNAAVAASYGRHMVAHVWSVLRVWSASRQRPPTPRRPPPPQAAPPPPPSYSDSSVEEDPLEEEEEWAESQFQYSGVLGVPTRTIYIPPAKFRAISDDGWVSAATAHYVDEDAMDWTLPEEAFPLRSAPPPPGPDPSAAPAPGPSTAFPANAPAVPGPSTAMPGPSTAIPGPSTAIPGPSTAIPGPSTAIPGPSTSNPGPSTANPCSSTSVTSLSSAFAGLSTAIPGSSASISSSSTAVPGASTAIPGPSGVTPGPSAAAPLRTLDTGGAGSPGAASSPGGSSSSGPEPSYAQQASVNSTEEGDGGGGGGGLAVRAGGGECVRAPPDIAELLADALKQHADLGDVQTAATAMLVLQDHRNDLFPYIDEGMQENWLLGYIDILQRHKLWNVATEVIRNAWLSSVWTISQQSTTVAMCCGRCGRRTRPHSACDRCQPRQLPEICAVCHEVVRGLYAWCQGCSHGGHLVHMRDWMRRHQYCPAGCGHQCQLG